MMMDNESAQRQPSIAHGVWRSFMLLTVAIIAILWLMQTVFLGSYYKIIKQNQIVKASRHVATSLAGENAEQVIESASVDNNLNIVLCYVDGMRIFERGVLGWSNIFRVRDPNYEFIISNYLIMAQTGELGEHVEIIHNNYIQKDMLLVVKSVTYNNMPAVLLMNGTIEPIWATADILKSQLIIITVILLVLSALIAFFLSRRISRPIVKITGSAKKLATGDYTPNFEGGSFQEVNELAHTLNTAATELGRVESLRRELVANVSHDLRTPLTMIKAYAEMLRDITGGNPEKRELQLGIIVDESDRLGRLVSDLVAISREETSGEDLEIETYDLVHQLIEMSDRFKMSYPDYQFSLSVSHSCMVSGDRDRIGQVLYNLVGNAVSYTGADKTVRIQQSVRGPVTRIEVIDTGPGVPPDEVHLIWQRYYRSSFHKTAKAGTGLGLSIVKEVMDAHGCAFGVENRPEGGSCFWFELPIQL